MSSSSYQASGSPGSTSSSCSHHSTSAHHSDFSILASPSFISTWNHQTSHPAPSQPSGTPIPPWTVITATSLWPPGPSVSPGFICVKGSVFIICPHGVVEDFSTMAHPSTSLWIFFLAGSSFPPSSSPLPPLPLFSLSPVIILPGFNTFFIFFLTGYGINAASCLSSGPAIHLVVSETSMVVHD